MHRASHVTHTVSSIVSDTNPLRPILEPTQYNKNDTCSGQTAHGIVWWCPSF